MLFRYLDGRRGRRDRDPDPSICLQVHRCGCMILHIFEYLAGQLTDSFNNACNERAEVVYVRWQEALCPSAGLLCTHPDTKKIS